MRKLVVRLVKMQDRNEMAIMLNEGSYLKSIGTLTANELAKYEFGFIDGISLIARQLNLSFTQDGEYITLEEK